MNHIITIIITTTTIGIMAKGLQLLSTQQAIIIRRRFKLFLFFSMALSHTMISKAAANHHHHHHLQANADISQMTSRPQSFMDTAIITIINTNNHPETTNDVHANNNNNVATTWMRTRVSRNNRKLLHTRVVRALAMKNIGSRPPSCSGKCNGCLPCNAVEVTVPPSVHKYVLPRADHVTHTNDDHKLPSPSGKKLDQGTWEHVQESPYYSVAWRCICKGKYFSP